MDVATEMAALREECLSCRKCSIGGQTMDGCLSNVFSNMNCGARLMAVGQNPGLDEVEQAEPFVGVSGKFFDKALVQVGMSRADFYVSNAVRCYAPDNRKPTPQETENCWSFLDREVVTLKPKLLVAMGAAAFKQLTGLGGIMKHHGTKVFSPRYRTFVVPVLHPSPLNINRPDNREAFMGDLAALKRFAEEQ